MLVTYNLEGNILENKKLSFHNALPRNCIKSKILEPVGKEAFSDSLGNGQVYLLNTPRYPIISTKTLNIL